MVFYEPHLRDKNLLPHDPFKAMIAPRPIGWISTISEQGAVNLAPYSFFNAFSDHPPILGFASSGVKDTLTFARATREFVWNMASWELRAAMSQTSTQLPRAESEFAYAGLESAPSTLVKPPRVAKSPCAMECVVTDIFELKSRAGVGVGSWLVLGEVVGVHLDPIFIKEGAFQTAEAKPLARCGYLADYAVLDALFAMERPENKF